MGLFHQFCRNLGLMIHHIAKPVEDPHKRVVSKTVEEKRIDDTTTLRRTTIEEIEIKKTPQ